MMTIFGDFLIKRAVLWKTNVSYIFSAYPNDCNLSHNRPFFLHFLADDSEIITLTYCQGAILYTYAFHESDFKTLSS
jgi:hypothetical protein